MNQASGIKNLEHACEVNKRVFYLDEVLKIADYDIIKVYKTALEQIKNSLDLE